MYMHMKYLMLIGLMLCVGASTVSAQPKKEARAEKIKAYRVAVFTEILNLSSEEAQGFWPIYNEYLDKRESLQKELKMTRQIDGMNDNEVEDYIKKYFELRNKELDLEKDLTQKLRKGGWSIQGEIDLHGLRTEEARVALAEFIRLSHRHGLRCLRVVHGKGLGSPGKTAVLKPKVHSWLIQKNQVMAFVQAKAAEGGAGALVVLLTPGS